MENIHPNYPNSAATQAAAHKNLSKKDVYNRSMLSLALALLGIFPFFLLVIWLGGGVIWFNIAVLTSLLLCGFALFFGVKTITHTKIPGAHPMAIVSAGIAGWGFGVYGLLCLFTFPFTLGILEISDDG